MKFKYDDIALFKDFAVDLYINDINYDLHNEFEVKSIDYEIDNSSLKILFTKFNDDTNILFTFYNVIITKLSFLPVGEETIIDQLYRGEPLNNNFDKMNNSKDKGYFYFSFLPEFNFEILTESISIEKNSEFCTINNGEFSINKKHDSE